MKISQNKLKTIDTYIKPFPAEVKANLQAIRDIVHAEAPEAVEVISYSMPAFKLGGRILIYFAGYKKHIGIYPYPSSVKAFAKELVKYKTSTSTIQIPLDQKLPVALVRKIIRFRKKELISKK